MELQIISEIEADVVRKHQFHEKHIIQHDTNDFTSSSSSCPPSSSSFQDDYNNFDQGQVLTKVFHRKHSSIGLGMQLGELNGCIYVNSLLCNDGKTRLFTRQDVELYIQQHDVHIHQSNRLDYDLDRNNTMSIDTTTCHEVDVPTSLLSPAMRVGVKPGDRILGVNGYLFLRYRLADDDTTHKLHPHQEKVQYQQYPTSSQLLTNAVEIISKTHDPIMLHILRPRTCSTTKSQFSISISPQRLFHLQNPTTTNHNSTSPIHSDCSHEKSPSSPYRLPNQRHDFNSSPINNNNTSNQSKSHPLLKLLREKGIIQSQLEEYQSILQLELYIQKALLWENNFYLNHISYLSTKNNHGFNSSYSASLDTSSPQRYRQHHHHQQQQHYDHNHQVSSIPSTHVNNFLDWEYNNDNISIITSSSTSIKNATAFNATSCTKLKSSTISQGLCIRIVNTFLNKDRMAYTIWVYDIENQKEWYAPIHYYTDFKELRSAILRICEQVGDIPFPSSSYFSFSPSSTTTSTTNTSPARSNSIANSTDSRLLQLEFFLRELCSLLYRVPLHPFVMSEVAIYLQTFLGHDTFVDDDETIDFRSYYCMDEAKDNVHNSLFSMQDSSTSSKSNLKVALQLHIYRILLLPVLNATVNRFVHEFRCKAYEILSRNKNKHFKGIWDKDDILQDLTKLNQFMTGLQNLLFEGCIGELNAIASDKIFASLNSSSHVDQECSFRDIIREQLEIEIYVPLRSLISKLLVNAWRIESTEVQLKMKVLKTWPQASFKISSAYQSQYEWKSVISILNDGVARNTLPCKKLYAIVDAAKEITRLMGIHRSGAVESKGSSRSHSGGEVIGADDFLPIFIFCVVQADIENPCALGVLLRKLCDPSKVTGEIGYYMSSFEAVISYIQNLDLQNK